MKLATLLVFFGLCVLPTAHAAERELANVPLWLPADVQAGDVDAALTSGIVGVMRSYVPAGYGSRIRNYRVSGNASQVNASLEIDKGFPIGKIALRIQLSAAERTSCDGIQGYRLELDLDGSDSRILDEAQALRMDLCFRQKPDGSFELGARSTLVEGDDFGGRQGEVVKNILTGQHWPLLLGMNTEISKIKARRLGQ